jgi:hypothetical protein
MTEGNSKPTGARMNELLQNLKTLLGGVAGVVAACGALLAALISFLNLWSKLRNRWKQVQPEEQKRRRKMTAVIGVSREAARSRSAITFVVSLTLFSLVAIVRLTPIPGSHAGTALQPVTPKGGSPETILQMAMHRVFLAFEKGETNCLATGTIQEGVFLEAITNVTFVIDNYSGMALRQQKALLQTNAVPPATGRVPSTQRSAILANGLVNDVGTCYFIKGRSLEHLGHSDQAQDAYQAATNFPYARTWDPRGEFFWSPAEAAAGRLEQIGKH